jgi:GNAT superfamily N-acetyltransferase
VDDAELARLEHENMVTGLMAVFGTIDGAYVERADGVAVLMTGLPALLFNQIIIDGTDTKTDAISRLVGTGRTRGHPFVVNLRVGADDAHVPLMAELGLQPLSDVPWIPGMAMHPIRQETSALPENHEIVRVADERMLEDNIITTANGFEMPEEWVRRAVSMAMVERPDIALYTGYTDGEPVSVGIGFRTGNTIGVYNVATVPAARRRGYGEHITRRITDDAVRAGCDVATLQASDMGKSIYQRLGYRTVVEYMGYVPA